MDKSNLDLFKQALNEAVSNKFDKMAAECTEEIVYSEKHKLTMRTIMYGKVSTKRALPPKTKRAIAILIAVALLLTSCAIIFRNEIREVFKEFFVSLTYEGGEEADETIKEVYSLGYVPDGYTLEMQEITPLRAQYKYSNQNGDSIHFEQRALTYSDYYIDSESGYSKIEEIEEYDVYYRFTGTNHLYVWNMGNYYTSIKSSAQLSTDEIGRAHV